MKVSWKAVKWVSIIAVLLIVSLMAYAYIIGTRVVLSQAEAFAFRRMTVTELADKGTFQFFFASNRVPATSDGPVDERFESQRQSEISFGLFDTAIEPSLGLGMIIDPSKWFLNEEIQLINVENLQAEAFKARLRAQVEASPERTLLLVVHGFRERFSSALRKTAFLAHVLDINTPVLVFDWPGDQGSSLRGYRRARDAASASGEELAELIELIVNEIQPDRLWMLANSMGGQVVIDAFHLLHRNPAMADAQTEIENVMLTAPDVDHQEFNQQSREEMSKLASNVTVYVSSNDRALLASRLINRGLRLGESTLDTSNPGQVQQSMKIAELLEANDDSLVLVDVTPVNRTRNFHNFSLETPEFFDDLYLRFTNRDIPDSRELYFLETPGGVRYFVLTRGR